MKPTASIWPKYVGKTKSSSTETENMVGRIDLEADWEGYTIRYVEF